MGKSSNKQQLKKATKAELEARARRKSALGEGGLLKLETKKKKFAAHYFANTSPTQASLVAGDSPGHARANAYRYLKDPEVQQLIDKHQQDFNENCIATIKWKMDRLINIVDAFAPVDSELPMSTKGAAVAVKAIAEMNKIQGHYAPEKTVNANLTMNVPIEDITKAKELVLQYDKPY